MPVRRSSIVLVAVAAVLSTMLVSPAGARVVTAEDPGSPAALAALSNVRSLLGGVDAGIRGLLPDGLTAEPSAPDLTMALRDLAVHRSELSGKELAEADAYLARPTDPPGPDNSDRPYSVDEATPVCSGAICVHYVATTADAPAATDADVNGIPDYVETVLSTTLHVHSTYVAAGYRAPKGDGALGGGSNTTDVYIADIGDDGLYGYCSTDQKIPNHGPFDAWAYCVLDNDYAADEFPTNTPIENLQVTIAHEYFHAVQFGYDIAEDPWFLEATAAWVEDIMYDQVDDNVQYLRQSPLRMPRTPMDTFGGVFHYGIWIFFRYVSERYNELQGGLPTIVRDMIRKTDGSAGAKDLTSIEAVKSVLKARGADFPSLFAKFSSANRRPADNYSEGRANHYKKSPLVKKFALGRRQSKGDELTMDHLTSATVRFKPASGLKGNAKLRIFVRMAPAKRGSAAVVAIKMASGDVKVVPVKIKASGIGLKTLPFSAKDVKYVELTLANAGTNYDCFNQGPYSCHGTSKNEDQKESFRATVLGG